MLLSDLAGKEIINLYDGAKLGLVGDADLDISFNGSVEAIILTSRGGFSGFWGARGDREREVLVIPWKSIKKIGSEVMIIDLNGKLDKNI
ncbi:MAG TPA: YlmC/YmxH family sporulation protein [Desulfosporosinus sp.]|nr:YlmC/YmxH family sporulation protein [Desulfosporosinus sp.]